MPIHGSECGSIRTRNDKQWNLEVRDMKAHTTKNDYSNMTRKELLHKRQ